MRVVVANAFSVNMLKESALVRFQKITVEEAKRIIRDCDFILSVVGHRSTARVISRVLGVRIDVSRREYTLTNDDILLVFVLDFRPEEGKIYSERALEEFFQSNKISIWLVEKVR